jgi:hypothetical protein
VVIDAYLSYEEGGFAFGGCFVFEFGYWRGKGRGVVFIGGYG